MRSHQSSVRSLLSFLLPNEHLATLSAAVYNGSFLVMELFQPLLASKAPRRSPKTSLRAVCRFSSSAVSPNNTSRSTAVTSSPPHFAPHSGSLREFHLESWDVICKSSAFPFLFLPSFPFIYPPIHPSEPCVSDSLTLTSGQLPQTQPPTPPLSHQTQPTLTRRKEAWHPSTTSSAPSP